MDLKADDIIWVPGREEVYKIEEITIPSITYTVIPLGKSYRKPHFVYNDHFFLSTNLWPQRPEESFLITQDELFGLIL